MDYAPAIPVDDPMAFLGSPVNEILKIEQEIKRHEQAIVNLKVKRNSHLPISKLPVELVCKIFYYTQDAWMASYGYSRFAGFPSKELAWIAVTRVCHYWRNAALNEPSLWTQPSLHYPKWTTVMLERSRMAGVTITFDNEGCCVRPDLLATIVSHIPHTTALTVRRISKQVVERLLTNLQSTVAPMLETLEIDGAYSPYLLVAMTDSSDRVPTRLPENVFLGATKLRRLSLTSVDIDWKSHLLSSLTDLTLEKISLGARPSRTEFLSILERNPGLRKLTLRDALPTSVHLANSSSDNRPRIRLISLEDLSITSEGVECEFFCNNVATSNKIKIIHMSFKYNHNNNRQLQKLLLAIHQATSINRLGSHSRRATIMGEFSPENILSPPTLCLSTSGRVRGSFSYDAGVPDYRESDDSTLVLDLDLQTPSGVSSREIHSPILSKFFHGLHWDNLAELVISGLRAYGTRFSATLAKTFGTLPQLRAVFVGDLCANHLIDALFINSNKDPGLFPNSITFPGLCHIGFNEVTFGRHYEEDVLIFDRLLDCLMNRCERGVEIHSVSIEDCRFFDDTYVEKLEEIVVEVDWDEEEHGYSDDEDEDEDEDMDMYEDPEFYDDSDYEDDVYGLYSGY